MKWACNYSKALIQLLQTGQLKGLDYIKAGAFGHNDLEEAFGQKPLLLHGFGWYERLGMDLAKAEIPEEFGGNLPGAIQRINKLAADYQSPHLAFHCLAYGEDMADFSGSQTDREEKLYQRMKDNVLFLKSQLQVPVLVENIDYCPNYELIARKSNHPYPTRPEVIRRLVEEGQIGFLFDLAHARVTADHLGMSLEAYCRKLPMDQLVEVHLSGSGIHPRLGRIDVHGELEVEDYEFIKRLIKPKAPAYITLEYGFAKDEGDKQTCPQAIPCQIKALKQIWQGSEAGGIETDLA